MNLPLIACIILLVLLVISKFSQSVRTLGSEKFYLTPEFWISIIFFIFAGYIIFISDDQAGREWAFGILGIIAGYWFK